MFGRKHGMPLIAGALLPTTRTRGLLYLRYVLEPLRNSITREDAIAKRKRERAHRPRFMHSLTVSDCRAVNASDKTRVFFIERSDNLTSRRFETAERKPATTVQYEYSQRQPEHFALWIFYSTLPQSTASHGQGRKKITFCDNWKSWAVHNLVDNVLQTCRADPKQDAVEINKQSSVQRVRTSDQ